jgi:hypothetical protein
MASLTKTVFEGGESGVNLEPGHVRQGCEAGAAPSGFDRDRPQQKGRQMAGFALVGGRRLVLWRLV